MPTSKNSISGSASKTKGPKDHINIRILQTRVSGIPLILGLGTEMSDPMFMWSFGPLKTASSSAQRP